MKIVTKITGPANIEQIKTLSNEKIQEYLDADNKTFYCDVCGKEPKKEIHLDKKVVHIEQSNWKQSLLCNDPKCLEYLKLLLC